LIHELRPGLLRSVVSIIGLKQGFVLFRIINLQLLSDHGVDGRSELVSSSSEVLEGGVVAELVALRASRPAKQQEALAVLRPRVLQLLSETLKVVQVTAGQL
jgi:hypothetical protein